jgi:hypothetical protein
MKQEPVITFTQSNFSDHRIINIRIPAIWYVKEKYPRLKLWLWITKMFLTTAQR